MIELAGFEAANAKIHSDLHRVLTGKRIAGPTSSDHPICADRSSDAPGSLEVFVFDRAAKCPMTQNGNCGLYLPASGPLL
jgi:hypothetical protein